MSAYQLIPVHPSVIDGEGGHWLRATLEQALLHADYTDLDADKLLHAAREGRALVTVILEAGTCQVQGIAAAELFPAVTGRTVCHITAVAGANLEAWLPEALPQLERMASEQGAEAMSLMGRPGWERVLDPHGYRRLAVMLGKDLEETDGIVH